jgi:acyl-coenzyme A synthetase/AMP-(fatty) acid ligase
MTNSMEFAAAFLAVVWIGAIPVLQNSQFGRSELDHIFALCDPTTVLFSEQSLDDPATSGLSPPLAPSPMSRQDVLALPPPTTVAVRNPAQLPAVGAGRPFPERTSSDCRRNASPVVGLPVCSPTG